MERMRGSTTIRIQSTPLDLYGASRTYAKKGKPEKRKTQKKKKGEGITGKYVCELKKITREHVGHKLLFEDLSLSMFYGAKIGIIGINGSGKSTLLKIIAGEEAPEDYDGTVRIFPNMKVGYLPQEPRLDTSLTVYENILQGVAEKITVLDRHEELTAEIARLKEEGEQPPEELLSEKEELQRQIREAKTKNLKGKIRRAMDALRCPPPDSPVDNLSGGEARRVALCKTLIAQPDLLLLDEPTNHLDAESVAWLEHYLDSFSGTVVAITHDRYFLDNVAGWILELDRGMGIPFRGNYSEWLESKAERLEQEKRSEKARQRMLRQELAWVNMPAKARHAKNKARISRYEQLAAGRGKEEYTSGTIMIPPGPRLGKVCLEVEDLAMSYGGRTLFEGLSFQVPPGAIIGIIGANGTGKSTLFRIITGQEQPDKGTVKLGQTTRLGFVTQSRDSLNGDLSVFDEIAEGEADINFGNFSMDIRSFIANFAFKGQDQSKMISTLSGGERNRVHLAKMLKRGPNVLLLDEPTNDLDVEVLRSLEAGVAEFAGTAIIVSHDRWFLDRLCTHIIAFEPEGDVVFFNGNYT
eukprot:CAMPEP_0114616274 /NCGR_PEP_ID=MMETSP0168-20121206/6603_1 /TAXON_ID=95228 ORGANISM="Vannella sp., Strain DIVA3 517/6/12" /NCGR_SAMPLE_ID=MMETSP0168 /ASSEMBLY_ACC=CAM_ASM_000044 /LENGTH=580 /DNA_ID=CAMNT_0001827385 /DNA_START=172 /DNA_END=1911 /DNA_ORIENTATION=-